MNTYMYIYGFSSVICEVNNSNSFDKIKSTLSYISGINLTLPRHVFDTLQYSLVNTVLASLSLC